MSNALKWASADLDNGLAAVSNTENLQIDSTMTDLLASGATKQAQLQEAAAQKLQILQSKTKNPWDARLEAKAAEGADKDLSKLSVNQYGNLENTVTTMPNGAYESNANKIWNDYSPEQLQMKLGDTIGNYALTKKDGKLYQTVKDSDGNSLLVPYEGDARRFYGYNTKENGSDVVKFGLSSAKYDTSDARYNPLTGWLPGEKGVDVNKNIVDVLLPYDKATELEGLIHGNSKALEQRVVKSGDTELRKQYGSGASEYYNSIDKVLGDVSQSDLTNVIVPSTPYVGTKSLPKELATRGVGRQVGDFAKAFASSFVKTGIVDVADAATEIAGYAVNKDWDIGTDAEKSEKINKALNYDNKYANAVGIRLQKLGEQVVSSDSSIGQKIEAIGEGAKLAFTNVDTMGTSLGTLAAWVLPGKVLSKLFTASREIGAAVEAIDVAVDAGKMTRAAALAEKAKIMGTAEGMLNMGINQVGHVTAAIGAVNNQYDAFVENNGGKDPEDKLKWFAERFSVQMLNQNLDAITDISVLKAPGLLALGKDLMKNTSERSAKVVAAKIGGQLLDLVAVQAPKEAVQEYTQEMMEMYNERMGSSRFKSLDTFTKFVTDEAVSAQAMGAAIGGAGGAGQFKTMGVGQTTLNKAFESASGAISAKLDKRADAKVVAEDKPTDDELDFMADTLSKIDAGTADFSKPDAVLNDLYKAESIFNRQKASSKNPDVVKEIETLIGTTKAKLLSQLDADDSVPTFGSRDAAEDYIDFVMENTPDVLNSKRLNKLEAIAKANGAEEYFKQAKNYFEVEKEAVEGPRGWKVYEREVKYALETAESNPAKLRNALTRVQKYLDTQEKYVDILGSAIEEAEQKAKQAKTQKSGIAIKPASIKVEELKTLTGKPYTIHFTEAGDVHPAAYELLETKKRNVEGLINIVNSAGDYMVQKKIKSPVDIGGGITIPDATSGKAKDIENINTLRAKDRAYYTKLGVTKVITDHEDARWNNKAVEASGKIKEKRVGDYYRLNRTKVNTGKYGKDDVVLVNIKKLDDKKVPKAVQEQIRKAMAVGATIVLDTGMYAGKEGKDVARVYGALFKQLTRYSKADNKYEAVLTSSGNKTGAYKFMPTAKASVLNEEIKVKAKAKKEQAEKKAEVFDNELLKYAEAVANKDKYRTSDAFKSYFKDSERDGKVVNAAVVATKYLQDMYMETVEAGAKVLTKQMLDRAISEDVTTDENRYDEAIEYVKMHEPSAIEVDKIAKTGYSKISSKVLKAAAMAEAEKRVIEYKEAFANMAEWGKLQEAQRSTAGLSPKAYKEAVEALGFTNKAFENSLKDTLANKVEEVDGKRRVTKKYKQADGVEQTLNLHVLPLDYIQVSNTTVLNSVPADLLLQHPVLGPKIKKMQASLKGVVDTGKAPRFLLQDAPGIALVFDEEGNVNVNVAAAMVIAMEDFYKSNSYMLTQGRKSVADIARMLHQDEDKVTPMMQTMLQDKGMFGKSMASQMSKSIAGLLGLSKIDANNDVEKMRYTQAITDLAHMTILAAIDAGELERDTSLSYKELLIAAGEVTEDVDSRGLSGEKLVFYRLTDDDSRDELMGRYDDSTLGMPIEEFYRKEPLYAKPGKAHIESKLKKIRNDKLGQEIAGEAKKAMTKMMQTEYKVDKSQLEDLLMFEDKIKAFMGYKEEGSDEFNRLHALGQDEQIVINREINKEFDELKNLVDKFGSAEELSMWFDFYYSTNGRYFYDSNTINPGTMKQLVRWLVQPKKHKGTVSYKNENGKHVFSKNGRDITGQMSFALGQAFGLPVDKKRIATTINALKPILDVLLDKENKADFDELFDKALTLDAKGKHAKVELADGVHIEIEHIAHMRQAFLALKGIRESEEGKVVTSLSAEFDAKTSGFGLKTSMMPLDDGAISNLQKTGQAIGGVKPLSYALDPDAGEQAMFDAYQSLAKDMIVDKTALEGSDIAATSAFKKAGERVSWSDGNALLLSLLPKVENTVSSALRNLFKQPFMEFNYSAGMKAIRKSLAYTMTRQLVDQVAYADKKEQEALFKQYGLSKYFTNLATFKELLNDANMERNKGYEQLVTHMDIMFGSQVQAIFEKNFPKAIQAQGVINQAFKAMFAMYKVAYDTEMDSLRAKGPVTEKGYIETLVKLHKMFPWIKGPLSQEGVDKDGIAIYKIKTSGAPGAIDGGLTSQVALNKTFTKKHGMVNDKNEPIGSATLGLEMARFEAAMNAGAVVPIHYIDGALLARLVNEYAGDLTVIHDAEIPAIEDAFDTTKMYNKALYEISYGDNRYKLIGEIKNALERVSKAYKDGGYKEAETHSITTYTNEYGTVADKDQKKSTLLPTEYMKLAAEQIDKLYNEVEAAIENIRKMIAKDGIVIEHMYSAEGGQYEVKGSNSKAETNVKDDTIQEDSKEKIFADLNALLYDVKAKPAVAKAINSINKHMKECDGL